MAPQRLFIVAAPRSGAGLLHGLSLIDPKYTSSELSRSSLVDKVRASGSVDSENSHSVSSWDFKGLEVGDVIAGNELSSDDQAIVCDFHHSFGLNVDFLAKTFPDAKFLFVTRNYEAAVMSGIRAWLSGKYVTEPNLEKWWGTKWSFGLVSNWIDLIGEPIGDVVASQLAMTTKKILQDLSQLPKDRWTYVDFDSVVKSPAEWISRATSQLGFSWSGQVPAEFVVAPGVDPSKKLVLSNEMYRTAVMSVQARSAEFSDCISLAKNLGIKLPPISPKIEKSTKPKAVSGAETSKISRQKITSSKTQLEANFTEGFLALLEKARASIVFSVPSSGLVGTVRAENGSIDTSYVKFQQPMGLAVEGRRLYISTIDAIESLHNHQEVTSSVAAGSPVDAMYVPQSKTYTGETSTHELGIGTKSGSEGLWFINSAFSCLSRLSPDYSFVPAWRPKWVTSLSNDHRCQLNGLAMVDGAPRYVTALSQSDQARGWQTGAGSSGVIVDIKTNRIIAEGLSMPHSPRWHNKQLYFLESGKGSLAKVDLISGEVSSIARLPGLTRGLAFIGNYAIVGLSKTWDFLPEGLPISQVDAQLNCGLWVIDLRSGKLVGKLKFDGAIQEIFDIVVLENTRHPVITSRLPESGSAFILPKAALKQVSRSR